MIRGHGVTLSAAVMAHPDRATDAAAFVAAHPELDATVVVDPAPGPGGTLRTAAAAMARVAPTATHHLVLQDDVVLAAGYADRLLATVAAHPDASVSLFAEWGSRTSWTVRLAALTGRAVAAVVDPYVPTQGVVVPRAVAESFVEHARTAEGPDDHVLADHLHALRVRSVVTVPHLLEHDDRPSLTGNGFQGTRSAGCFLPDVSGLTPVGAAGDVAGSGLARVPHVSWMRGVAEWFATARPDSQTFVGTPLLADVDAADVARLHDAFRAHVAEVDGDGAARGVHLRDVVDDVVLVEVWLAAYVTGRAAGVGEDAVVATASSPVGAAAVRSALPGALRRFLADPARTAVAEPSGRLVAAAAALGARHAQDGTGPGGLSP